MQETEDIVTRLEERRNWVSASREEYVLLDDAIATIATLRDELKAVTAHCDGLVDEAATLRAEVEGLRADAERYRWLKHKAPGEIVFDHINDDHRFELYVPFDGNPIDNDKESNARLDAAIDAAKADKEGTRA